MPPTLAVLIKNARRLKGFRLIATSRRDGDELVATIQPSAAAGNLDDPAAEAERARALRHPVAADMPVSRSGDALRKFNLKSRPPRSSMRSGTSKAPELAQNESPNPAAMPARAASPLQQRNRQLAAVLGCIAAGIFVTVVSLAMMFHYAEAHHLLAQL